MDTESNATETQSGETAGDKPTPQTLGKAGRCRFCHRDFAVVGVHQARCAKNPNRLPGYGGKLPKIRAPKKNPLCRYCAQPFEEERIRRHESRCPRNPRQAAATKDIIVTNKVEWLDKEMQRALLVNMGNGKYKAFLLNGKSMEPLELTVVDVSEDQ